MLTTEELNKKVANEAAKLGMDLNYKPETVIQNIDVISNDEWLESRRKGIGGSDAAAVYGVPTFKSVYEISRDKLSIGFIEQVTPEKQYLFDYGHDVEHALLNYYGNKYNVETFVDRRQVRHPLYPFMICDSDGFAELENGEIIGLEFKSTQYFNKNKWKSGVLGEDAVFGNSAYEWQLRHSMAVWNINRFDIMVTFGNNAADIVTITVYRDMALEKSLIEAEKTFWHEIQKGNLVESKSITKTQFESIRKSLLKDRKEEVEDFIELPSEFKKLAKEYLSIDDAINELNAEIDTYKERQYAIQTKVMTAMQNHIKGLIKDDATSYIVESVIGSEKNKFNTTKFKKDHPDLFDEYNSKSPGNHKFSIKRDSKID